MHKTIAVLMIAGLAVSFGSFGMASALEPVTQLAESGIQEEVKEDPRVGHYADETKSHGFVLDRTREMARVRFDDAKEILVLKMVPGPQGVTYFKDEFDRTILRLMPYGGATVYDADGTEGGAYGRDKNAKPLELKPRGLSYVERRAKEVQDRLHDKHQLKLKLGFEPSLDTLKAEEKGMNQMLALAENAEANRPAAMQAPSAMQAETRSSAQQEKAAKLSSYSGMDLAEAAPKPQETKPGTTVADAVEVLNAALKRLAKDELAREVIDERLEQVTFRIADEKAIAIEEANLVISYVPDAGLDGRMSSAEIEQFLLENL